MWADSLSLDFQRPGVPNRCINATRNDRQSFAVQYCLPDKDSVVTDWAPLIAQTEISAAAFLTAKK